MDQQDMTKYILDKLEKIDSNVDKITVSIASLEEKNKSRDVEIAAIKEDVVSIKTEQANIKIDIANLKQYPAKSKADKWDVIANYIFKGILALLGAIFLWVIVSGNLPNAINKG